MPTGDGFVAALQVARGGAEAAPAVSEVCHASIRLPQILKNVPLPQRQAATTMRRKSAIDAGEKRLNGHGRLLIRPSGTEP